MNSVIRESCRAIFALVRPSHGAVAPALYVYLYLSYARAQQSEHQRFLAECGSKKTTPLNFVSHSLSIAELDFIFSKVRAYLFAICFLLFVVCCVRLSLLCFLLFIVCCVRLSLLC
jgi:hypothetical protein